MGNSWEKYVSRARIFLEGYFLGINLSIFFLTMTRLFFPELSRFPDGKNAGKITINYAVSNRDSIIF